MRIGNGLITSIDNREALVLKIGGRMASSEEHIDFFSEVFGIDLNSQLREASLGGARSPSEGPCLDWDLGKPFGSSTRSLGE